MRASDASWASVATPIAFLVGAGVLTRFITDRPEVAESMARGIAGPTAWPTAMLYGAMVFALAWTVQRVATVLRAREQQGAGIEVVPPLKPVGMQVWLGILLVLGYGFSLPILGFALATAAYIVLWLLLGGVRSPLQIVLLGVVGTIVLLYLFVKLALMPLDRGAGPIGEFTVVLYRLLHVF